MRILWEFHARLVTVSACRAHSTEYPVGIGDSKLRTPATPDSSAESFGQFALLLQQSGIDLGKGHAANAQVVGRGVSLGVLSAMEGGAEDGVGGSHGHEGGLASAPEEGADRGGTAVGGEFEDTLDEAHCGGGRRRG